MDKWECTNGNVKGKMFKFGIDKREYPSGNEQVEINKWKFTH